MAFQVAGISHSPGGAFKAQTETFFALLHEEVAGKRTCPLTLQIPDPMSSLMRYTDVGEAFFGDAEVPFLMLGIRPLRVTTSRNHPKQMFFQRAVTRVVNNGFEPFQHCALLLTKHRVVWSLQCLPLPLQGVFAGPEPQHLLQQHAECEQVRQHQKLMSTKMFFVKHVVFCGAARHSKQF